MVLPVENKRIELGQQLQTRPLPARAVRTFVVNLGHFRAQSADVDRKIAQQFLAPELLDHGQHFLRLTQRKHGNQNAAALCKGAIDRGRQTAFLLLRAKNFPATACRRASSR